MASLALMSWDLYLKPSRGSPAAFLGGLRHALRRTQHFTDMGGGQFEYLNDETGVYFGLDITEPAEDADAPTDEQDEDDDSLAVVTINYARPSPFGREAAQVLSEIARDLPLLVRDDQQDGTWQTFDAATMADSYRHANLSASSALARHLAETADTAAVGHPVPRALLDYAWEWNSARADRDARRKTEGRNLWVPKYEFIRIGGQVFSFVFWFDGVATLFPRTDLVGIHRNKYQLKSPGLFGRKRPSLAFVPRTTIQPILDATYQPDTMVPDALSPIEDGGAAGQDQFLARGLGQDAVAEMVYMDNDDYRRRDPKPWHRLRFDELVDAEAVRDAPDT